MENMHGTGGLRAEYKSYECQECFVGHSREAEWRQDILSGCAEVLPKFGLEPWYAADHFDPTKPLRDKVVELIANSRYGIYDLSSWQDAHGEWHLPRNVLIELGMAIVLNGPTLLLCHTSNKALPLPACLQGVDLVEFAGETTLKKALEERLPQWFDVPPDRHWLNRFCIFGNRVCSLREVHPRARQWGHETLRCYVSDGIDRDHPCFLKAEREEIRGAFEDVFSRYSDLMLDYLDELSPIDGYRFTLCSHCENVRSTPFAVYRILPHTPAEVFITIGMSIALETLFEYDIPKVLLVRQEQDLPSLLRGYEVVEAVNSSEVKKKLKAFIPAVMQKVRETAWKPRPLPFIELTRLADIGSQVVEPTKRQNEMMAVQLYVDRTILSISGEGYNPVGEFSDDGRPVDLGGYPGSNLLLRAALLCNDARLEENPDGDGSWRMVGDPTEGALVVAAAKAGFWREELEQDYPRLAEIPFDSERKRMTTIHPDPKWGGYVAYVKGAPDIIIGLCHEVVEDGQERPLTDERRQRILEVNEALASNALCVLGVAYRPLSEVPKNPTVEEVEKDLTFVGLIGMIESAQLEVKEGTEYAR